MELSITFREDEINKLDKLAKKNDRFVCFGNIFNEIKLYKKIDEAKLINIDSKRGQAIYEVCNELGNCANIDKLIIDKTMEVINTLPDHFRNFTLKKFSWALTKCCQIDKVMMEFVDTEPYKGEKDVILKSFSRELMVGGNTQKAIDAAYKISCAQAKSETLSFISLTIAKSDFGKALQIAETIPDEDIKNKTFNDMIP